MSIQVKRRREAASFLSTFVGAQGELLVDTTNNRVQVHDGTTPGGWPAAKLAEVVTTTRTAIADANYAALAGDRTIAFTAITAARTVTLPAAAAYPTGTRLLVFDESGACSIANAITLAAAGSDRLSSSGSTPQIVAPFGYLALQSNGANAWTIVDAPLLGGATLRSEAVVGPGGTPTLTVKGNVNKERFSIYRATQPQFDGFGAGTSVDAPTAVGLGQMLFALGGHGHNGSAFTALAAALSMITTEAWGATNNGTAIRFMVTRNGSTAAGIGAEAMRLDNTGYLGIGTPSPAQPLDVLGTIQTHGAYGSTLQLGLVEDTIACSGATSTSTRQIPNRAIVLAVSVTVVSAITGASSFSVDATTSASGGAGASGGQFGAGLGTAAGSSNVGVIGPTAWYAPSTIKLTAAGGSFTGGTVRVAIQYLICGAPTM